MACRFTLAQRVLPQGVKFPYMLHFQLAVCSLKKEPTWETHDWPVDRATRATR